jgi:hypothetical protein
VRRNLVRCAFVDIARRLICLPRLGCLRVTTVLTCFGLVAPLVAEYSDWSTHYGYLDAKPMYLSKNGAADGELYLKVRIQKARYFWLCGLNKESLQNAVVLLDANVKDSADLKDSYQPKEGRVALTKFTQIGNECRQYEDVPHGMHVIGVATEAAQAQHISAVTHFITWP